MIDIFYGKYSSFLIAIFLGIFFGIVYDAFRIIRISRLPYLMPQGRLYEYIKIPRQKTNKIRKKIANILNFSDNIIIFAEDMFFWIIASIAEILFIYHINGGVIRIYFILCTFLGAAVYFFSVGKLTIYFSVRIIFLLRCLLYWLFYIIIYPIRMIFAVLKKIIYFIVRITVFPIVLAVKAKHKNKYSKKRVYLILDKAKKGFCIK